MTCLGDELAALVDGELDHAARERAQSHLLACDGCRAEVDAQRRLKSRLAGLAAPVAAPTLAARLLDLRVPGVEPAPPALPAATAVRPVSVRPAPRPSTPRRSSRLRRRAGVGSALLVAGLAGAFALGGPREAPSTVPVDPASTVFVSDFSGGGGSDRPVVTSVVGPAR